jgi:ribosome-binding factor A
MSENRREKRVSSLITEELGRIFIEEIQGRVPGLITVTRVEMAHDLLSARVYVSVFGDTDKEGLLALLEKRTGHIRKRLASRINLRYNPQLVFTLDPAPEYEERLDRLMEAAKKHDDS